MFTVPSRLLRAVTTKVLVAACLTMSSALAATDKPAANATPNKKPAATTAPAVGEQRPVSKGKAMATISRIPLGFEANHGQMDSHVQYLSRGAGYTLFLTRDEAVLSVAGAKGTSDVVRIKLDGTNAKSKVTALERLGWDTNYFIGNDPAKWRTHVPNYRKVNFDDVYPGVSLVYYGNQQQLEHDFVVAPNADPKKIAMEIAGAKEMQLDENGNLLIQTEHGALRFEKPVIYQDVNGTRKDVAGKFVLRGKTNIGFEVAAYDRSKALIIDPVINFGTLLSASVGVNATGVAVDASGNSYVTGTTQATTFPGIAPPPAHSATPGPSNDVFVIQTSADGSTLGYVSFIGSSGTDTASGIALDGSNSAYITGTAACTVANTSTDFPTTANSFQQSATCPGTSVAYLSVLDVTGSTLLYSTLYGGDGGTGSNSTNAVSVVGQQAFITGFTNSSATPLPTSTNAFSASLTGPQDAFLAQFDTTSSTVSSGTCDGVGSDTLTMTLPHSFVVGEQVIVSGVVPNGANLGGTTFNTPANQHSTITAVTATTITYVEGGTCNNAADTGAAGTTTGGLVYGSYLGGALGSSNGNAVLATSLTNVYVGGSTNSAFFPTAGGAQGGSAGGPDGFVALFDPTQPVNTLVSGTYLSGSGNDAVQALAFGGGNLYAAGNTTSTDFPLTAGVQPANGGGQDAFVASLTPNLAIQNQATYLGGTGNENANAISVEPGGAFVWVGGSTTTPTVDNIFNVNAIDGALSGTQDGFIAKFNAALTTKDVATYFGGTGNADAVNAIVATAADTVIVAGSSDSTNLYTLGGTTATAYQTTPFSATTAGFVAKFSANATALSAPLGLVAGNSVDPLGFGSNTTDYTFTVTNNDPVNNANNVTLDLHMDLSKLQINTVTPTSMACVQSTQLNANSGVTCDVGTLAAAGGTANLDVQVQVTAAGACTGACTGSSVNTNVSVGAAEALSNTSTTVTSSILPVADVSVTTPTATGNLSGSGLFVVQKDGSFTYSYVITNTSANMAPNVVVTNNLPAGFSASTVTLVINTGVGTPTCPAAPQTGTFTCGITGFTGGSTATMTLTGDPTALLANNVASANNLLDFSASATPAIGFYIDPLPANNSGSITGSVITRNTALTLTLTDNGPVAPGAAVTFTETVNNGGPSTATNLKVSTPVNAALTVGSNVPGAMACTAAGVNPVVCTQATLANAGSSPVTINATAPAVLNQPVTIAAGAGSLTRSANVVTVTTSAAHPFVTGQTVEIARATYAGATDFNGKFVITGTPTATTFTYAQTGPNDATGANGTAFITGPQTIGAAAGSATRTGGVSTITTAAANGFAAGQTVTIAGVSNATYDGLSFVITSIISPTQFTYAQPTQPDDNTPGGSGGTATINPAFQSFATTATLDSNPTATSDNNTPPLPITATTNTQVETSTDIAIGATFTTTPVSATPVSLAGPLTYALQVTNTGVIAPNTTVRFTLTTGTNITSDAIVTSVTGANACTVNTGIGTTTQTIDCLFDNLPVGPTTLTLGITPPVTTTINAGTTNSDSLSTSATISSDFVNDTNATNNTTDGAGGRPTPVTNTIQRQADLDITTVPFAGAPSPVALAGPLNYTYTIKNNGPDTALNVLSTITEASSAVTTPLVVLAPINATCVINGNNVDCKVASLASGASVAITVPITPPLLTSMTLAGGAAATDTLTATVALDPQVSTFETGAGTSNGTTVNTTLQRTADVNIAAQPFIAARSASVLANTPASTPTNITTNLTSPMSMTFGLTNAGPDTALNAKVLLTNVTSPVGTAISGISSSAGSTCTLTGGNIQCSVDTVPTVGTTTITVNFVPLTPTSMTLAGAASATGSFTTTTALNVAQPSYVDGNAGNDTNGTTVTTNLQRQSDLQFTTFSVASTSPTPGTVDLTGQLTYTVGITNAGPDPALKEQLNLNLNTGPLNTAFSFISAGSTIDLGDGNGAVALPTAATNGCVPAPGPTPMRLNCEKDAPMPAGAVGAWTIKVTPPLTSAMNAGASSSALTANGLFGSFSVWDNGTAGAPANPGNNVSPSNVGTTIERQADLGVAIAQSAATVNIGAPITYTLTLTNAGPSTATNVTVTNTLPAGFVLSGPPVCGGAVTTCDPAGQSFALTTFATASSPQTITITGSFPNAALGAGVQNATLTDSVNIGSTAVIDSNGSNDSSSVTTTLQRSSDLGIVVGQSATTVSIGGPITYTLTLTNAGPNDATNVTLTNTLPAGFVLSGVPVCSAFVTTCDAAGQNFALTTFATANSPQTITITGSFPAGALGAGSASTSLNDSATIGSITVIDSNSSNNSSSVTTTLQRSSDLGIGVVQSAPTVSIGAPITYTLTVTNAGPNDATNVTVTNTLPAGFVLSGPPVCGGAVTTCDPAGQNFVLNPYATANSPQTITITGSFPAGALGAGVASASLNDSATVGSTTVIDSNLSNNSSSVTTTLQRQSDLGVTIGQSASTVSIGVPVTYTLTVTNAGPNDATNVTVTNTLPAGFVLSGPPICGAFVTTCDPAGQNFALNPYATANSPQTITITGSFPAGALANNAASATLSDSVGINSTSVVDTNPVNNAASVNTTLQRSSDLGIVVSQSAATINVGAPLTYTLTLTNAGPNDATNVNVANNLPAGFGVTSVNCGPSVSTCDPAGLAFVLNSFPTASSPQTITITGSYANGALANNLIQDNTKQDSANITSATLVDPNLANNSSSITTTLQRSAHLSINSMTGVPTTATPSLLYVGPNFNNQTIAYTIVAANNGPDDAVGAVVTQVLPAGFALVSATATYGANPPFPCTSSGVAQITVKCDFGTFGAAPGVIITNGTTATINVTAQTTPTALPALLSAGTGDTTATVSSLLVVDPTPGAGLPQTANVSTVLHGEADLAVDPITVSPVLSPNANIYPGDDEVFTIKVRNLSAVNTHPSQANLTFSATLPKDYVVQSISTTGLAACPAGPLAAPALGGRTSFNCPIAGGLSLGQAETITVRAHVPAGIINPASSADASIHSLTVLPADGEDTNLADNAASLATTVIPAADVVAGEVAVNNPTLAGNATTFTVTISNPVPTVIPQIGGSNALGLTVHNVLTVTPGSPTITVTAASGSFNCPVGPISLAGGTNTVDCTAGTVSAGGSSTITLTTTPGVIGTITNAVSIPVKGQFDPVTANDTATLTDRVDNTPVCAPGGCNLVVPVDPITGLVPALSSPSQNVKVQYNNVTTQGSTTMTVAAQPAGCTLLDSTTLPAGSTVVNDAQHVPYHGLVSDIGSRTFACGTGATPLFYNISTTAASNGGADVCVDFTGTTFHKANRVRLLLLTGGVFDITVASGFSAPVTPVPFSPTVVCGHISNFSGTTANPNTVQLAVMEPSNVMPDLTAATATPNNSVAARGAAGNAVDLSAAGTFDNDGPDNCIGVPGCVSGKSSDTLTYRWISTGFLGNQTVPGSVVTVPVSATGAVTITLVATDPYGDSERRTFVLNFSGTGGGTGGGGGGGGGGFISSATVNKGQSASFTTALINGNAGATGITITNATALANSQIVCSLSPSTLPSGTAAPTAVTMLCSTQGQIFARLSAPARGGENGGVPMLAGMIGMTALPLLGMLLMPGKSRRRRLLKMWAAVGLVLIFTMFQAACGGGGASSFGGAPQLKNAGTPSGTYQVMLSPLPAGVTADASTGTTAPTTFTLTVQ